MNKSQLFLVGLAMTALPVLADGLELEAGYAMVNAEQSDIDIDLGALYGVVGYRWDHATNYSSSAEATLLLGIQDDDVFGADVSLDPSYSIGYKGTWKTANPDFTVYWRASYATIGAEIDGLGITESADDSGFGIGAGAAWRGFTIGYTKFLGDLDDLGMITIGYQYSQ